MFKFKHQRITNDGKLYLHRIFLKKDESLAIHLFYRPDDDRVFHDHPHDFRTIVLWGGYEEESHELCGPWIECRDGRLHESPSGKIRKDRLGFLSMRFREAEHAHRITRLRSKVVITLVFRGKKRRDWGFWIPPRSKHRDTSNPRDHWMWVYWRDYLGEYE